MPLLDKLDAARSGMEATQGTSCDFATQTSKAMSGPHAIALGVMTE